MVGSQKWWVLAFLVACGSDDNTTSPNPDTGSGDISTDAGGDTASPDVGESPAVVFDQVCRYTNPFSRGAECRSYVGQWTAPAMTSDCDAQSGEAVMDACADDGLLGRCEVEVPDFGNVYIHAYGEATACDAQRVGCTVFAKGTWQPEPACGPDVEVPATPGEVFQPPVRICRDPLPGEPAGSGPDGQVCTWQVISGATEEGRKFADYASCDVVRTQRPYYAYRRADDAEREDVRLQDPQYVTELNWVKSQIEATACACCHQSSLTPDGVSNWDIDQPGNFMNGFFDSGLALGANWVDSMAFGAFEAQENNGFDRTTSGFPSTDPERMVAFFRAELAYRGKTEADFANTPPFGGPLYDQIFYQPEACSDGEGVSADGTVRWTGGNARYLYILEDGSLSPTVPPNLDTPSGTLWRLDVAPDAQSLKSGEVKLGQVPQGSTQKVPDMGAPELVSGMTYYLYASADVGVPLTRCIFEAP